MKIIDLSGQMFDYLYVKHRDLNYKVTKHTGWLCECVCGKTVTVTRPNLLRKGKKSCGCMKANSITQSKIKHSMCGTPAYFSWNNMRRRCTDPKNNRYKYYGERGIKVCESWINSFENFIQDMGVPEKGMSIERINNSLGYNKENCKWIPKSEQAKNRTCNLNVIFKGKIVCATELWRLTEKRYNLSMLKKYIKLANETIELKNRLRKYEQ